MSDARIRQIAADIYVEVADEPLGDLFQRRQKVQEQWFDAVRAALASDQGMTHDDARAYFERGFVAAYAWAMTKRDGVQLSDTVIDHAWDHRDEGMAEADRLPPLTNSEAIPANVSRLWEELNRAEGHESQAVMVKCADLRAILSAGKAAGDA